jgi:hypothetical protein
MMSNPSADRDPPSRAPGSGFQGQIRGASLADLVQMECLAGSRRVVRVISGNNSGFMYFRGGAIVHAAVRSQVGEAAAMELLRWNEGTFEPVEREWPAKETISVNWQTLLLRAAQMRDEGEAANVIALRVDGKGRPRAGAEAVVESVAFDVTPIEVGDHVLRSEDLEYVIRLNASGTVLQNHGAQEDFADIVAYACRLTELIGSLLGVDQFVAMECTFKSGRCFIVVEADGDIVAFKPRPSTDLNAIRALFGL